jgi:hypothetical protein
MTCGRCKKKVLPGIRFCDRCGLLLTNDTDNDAEEILKEMTSVLQNYPNLFADVLAKAHQ